MQRTWHPYTGFFVCRGRDPPGADARGSRFALVVNRATRITTAQRNPWKRCTLPTSTDAYSATFRASGSWFVAGRDTASAATGGEPAACYTSPKVQRVIYLFQSGRAVTDGPVRLLPADGKRDIELPDSTRMGQRFTTMTAAQKSFRRRRSFQFARHALGDLAERVVAAHCQDCFYELQHHSLDARGDQSRPGHHVRTNRALGPAERGAWIAFGLGSS